MRFGFLFLIACGAAPPSVVPSDTPLRVVREQGPDPSPCLVVFLPGAGDTADDYVDHGFVARLREAGVRADAWAVDARVPDYRNGRAIRLLHEEVLGPARVRYESVWLVGISMGGGGALRTAAGAPDLVDHVVLLAPFLGGRGLMRRVRASGGPAHFVPTPEQLAADPFVTAWDWAGEPLQSDGDAVSLYVGWGHEDVLADIGETLAMSLPRSHVIRGGGGHRWPVWSDLWRGVVESGFMQRACGVEAAARRSEAAKAH